MNCDDVFDALTDPALDSSAEVAGHLLHCPRCRQLQEVLEPARSLLCGDLPSEDVPTDRSNEFPRAARPASLLSVESVGLAESIAARLASSRGGKSVPLGRPFEKRPLFVAVLRGAALVLFGALAVYCMGSREGNTDSHPLPAIVPPSKAANTCTRMDLQRKRQTPQDARHVILSCVVCHMNDHQPQRRQASALLFWPLRQPSVPFRLALLDADDGNGEIGMAKSQIRMTKEARMS